MKQGKGKVSWYATSIDVCGEDCSASTNNGQIDIYLGLFTTSALWYLLKCKVFPSKYFSVWIAHQFCQNVDSESLSEVLE